MFQTIKEDVYSLQKCGVSKIGSWMLLPFSEMLRVYLRFYEKNHQK